MAILWCDPYIESPSGGVDGTTGVGTLGTYSNPYSLNNLPNNTGYVDGDEIRLKSLPTTGAWLTGPIHSSDSGISTYAVYCTVAPDKGSFIKYTDKDGEVMYTSWNTANRKYVRSNDNAWQGVSTYADTTQLMYKLDPQYYISNMIDINQEDFIRGQANVATTLTAGWVSETARGGETIIQHIEPGNAGHYWFGGHPSSNKMTVDAPELTISQSHSSTSRRIYIYGETVEIHAVIERSGYGSSNYIYIYTALTFKAHTLTSGSYINIHSPYYDVPATQGINRDVKHLMCGYYMSFANRWNSTATSHFKIKSIATGYMSLADETHLSYYDKFYVFFGRGQTGTGMFIEMPFDSAVSVSTDATKLHYDSITLLSDKIGYGDNHNYRNYYGARGITRDGSYLIKGAKIDTAYGDVVFRDYRMPAGETLEASTYNNVIGAGGSNQNYYQGTAWGVDRNSGRTLAFVRGSSNTDQAMMMYNSTEYGGKLVYHLMPNPTSSYFRNRINMAMPTGVSVLDGVQAYKLKITLAGTTVGSVSLNTLRLEGNSNADINWTTLPQAPALTIDAASGGAGTIIYSGAFNNTANLAGIQQFSLLAQFRNNSTTAVAKICFESIELVEV